MTPTHRNKNKPSVMVKVLKDGILRIAQTKRACVIYEEGGILHVRPKAEFHALFEPYTPKKGTE